MIKKNEDGGKNIEEFVGLKAELYSFKTHKGKEEDKRKGVKKVVEGFKSSGVSRTSCWKGNLWINNFIDF